MERAERRWDWTNRFARGLIQSATKDMDCGDWRITWEPRATSVWGWITGKAYMQVRQKRRNTDVKKTGVQVKIDNFDVCLSSWREDAKQLLPKAVNEAVAALSKKTKEM